MNCPNCGRTNPPDAAYCVRCAFKLTPAPARGSGISYRRTETAEPHGGGGQGMVAFGAVLLAGMLFVGGAIALFVAGQPAATRTPLVAVGESGTPTLPPFIQDTPTPTVPGSFTPLPTFILGTPTPPPLVTPLITPTPTSVLPTDTPTPSDTPTATTTANATPTRTPTRTPTQRPTATPTRRPTPTPTPTNQPPPEINCDAATGTPDNYKQLGSNRTTLGVPDSRYWCLTGVRIEPGPNYGNVRLLRGSRILFQADCNPGGCAPAYDRTWSPDEVLVRPGQVLSIQFTCDLVPETPEIDDCSVAPPPGAVVTIGVEVFPITP